uniref:NADH-ubiquinone oxidoreductase chain 2 n=1 Tax=Hyalessa maculaticollis TaxID=1195103 RepID=A0A344ALK2_9HEMI|nr:NADH dehydrogenase subunit 2 [Hyalessa maculaticollis]ULO25729.1 NADH dehydrogenase subunit 2 [Hyalessa maculaticollis]
MKSNSSNLLFFTFMMIGIIISISSNNWLGCWMGIEINLISFLPIMMNSVSVYSSESMIKYFIIQSLGSSLLFFSIMFMLIYNINYLLLISLLIKMGCPPFHLWFPSVMEGLTWNNCFLLSTIQKLVPFMLMSYLNMNFTLFIITSCLWGSLGGLMYSSLRKIITYSSIYNLGWIISGIYLMNYSWIIYYIIYSLTLFIMCYSFNVFGMNYLNQFFLMSMSYTKLMLMMIILLSMGGMPPLLGFFPKMILIYCLIMNDMTFLCFILLVSALLVMFFYLRIIFTGMMIYSVSLKYIGFSMNWLFYFFSTMSLFGLLIFSMLIFYF